MHTVTFYSYKGGVGRTLVVANIAKYLAHMGMSVFVLDFDLEAPGLHYKFESEPGKGLKVERGLVDILSTFATVHHLPERLTDYVATVASPAFATGTIRLLPAGDAPSAGYWKALSKVNWHTLFYAEGADGIPLFLELKAFIEETYAPDFVLIDARTGITEMGGVATTVLSDQVVCMMLPTPEHLEGTRGVMHAIRAAPRLEGAGEISLLAVLSRLPHRSSVDEAVEVEQVKAFLNEPMGEFGSSLHVEDLPVLHRDPALEEREHILVGGSRSLDESLLLQDYVRLFVRLVPPSRLERSVGQLIEDINIRIMREPDEAEQAIEALAKYCLHPEAYRALLAMYKVRRSSISKSVHAVYIFWKITNNPSEPLLWETIKSYRRLPSFRPSPQHLDAMEAIWRARDPGDARFALELSSEYEAANLSSQAIQVLESNVSTSGASADTVARLVDLLIAGGKQEAAHRVVVRHKKAMAAAPRFLEAWAEEALSRQSYGDLRTALLDPLFDLAVLEKTRPALAVRLRFFLDGDTAPATAFLNNAKLQSRPKRDLLHLGALARDLAVLDAFKLRLAKLFPVLLATAQEIESMPALPSDDDYADDYGGGDKDIPF